MSNQRSRNFCLITYHEKENIEYVLKNNPVVRHWCCILHDKDKKEGSEELKEPHFHVLINLNNAMTERAVQKLFPSTQSTLSQIMRDKSNCFCYLTHEDVPDKHQYDEKDIMSDDLQWWKGLCEGGEDNEKFLNILNDITSNVPLREMARRYGRDIIINYGKYRDFANEMQRREQIEKRGKEIVELPDEKAVRLVDLATGEVVKYHRVKPRKLSK